MEFRHLGRSGLLISEIAYGNWITHGSQIEEDAATACVREALELGITTFDTADVYAGTRAEAVLGRRTEEGLTYPTWWDPPHHEGPGSIARAWNAAGVPTLYVLDGKGVIRFVDLRYEDLLKGVRQLLAEHTSRPGRTVNPPELTSDAMRHHRLF